MNNSAECECPIGSFGSVSSTGVLSCSNCPANAIANSSGIGGCQCKTGYYNTMAAGATSVVCTVLPTNSKNDPLNNANFICFLNFVKTGSACVACPSGSVTLTVGAACECD